MHRAGVFDLRAGRPVYGCPLRHVLVLLIVVNVLMPGVMLSMMAMVSAFHDRAVRHHVVAVWAMSRVIMAR
jgi:hypothetical protein